MGELVVETELTEYLQVRHAKIDSPASTPDGGSSSSPKTTAQQQPSPPPGLPSKFYKVRREYWRTD